MNSITQALEKLLGDIKKVDIVNGITAVTEDLYESFDEFTIALIKHQLEELDKNIFLQKELRKDWNVLHKDVGRSLICKFGTVTYKRRYYKNKLTNAKAHLVDEIVGITKHDRIESGLAIELAELVSHNAYEKSAEIACNGRVSRQSVMKKVRQVKDYELEETEERTSVKEIHVQVDEDHVALQNGKNTIVKLATVHEPRKKLKKKAFLPQKRHYAGYKEKPEDFWCRVSEGIAERYGVRDDLKVYIHGDGALWIKTGLEFIPNSSFILDRFHLHKYINRISCQNLQYQCQIWQYLRHENYKDLKVFIDTIVANDEIDADTGVVVYRYLKNNKAGIKNLLTLPRTTTMSCAEGQVSHVLSDRLSSRPCAWMHEGLETITQLRVFKLNGGKLKTENVKKENPAMIKHKKKIIEMRKKAAPATYHKNFDINKYIPKTRDNYWLKKIAGTS